MKPKAARNVLAGTVMMLALGASSAIGEVPGKPRAETADRRAFEIQRFVLAPGETHMLGRDILPGTKVAIGGSVSYSHPGPPPEDTIRRYDAFYDIYDDGQLATNHVVVLYRGGSSLGTGLSVFVDGSNPAGNIPAFSSVNEYDVTLHSALPEAGFRHPTYTGPAGSTSTGSLSFRVAIPVPELTRLAYRFGVRSEPKTGAQTTREENLGRVFARGEGTIKAAVDDPRCERASSVVDHEMLVGAKTKRSDDLTRFRPSRKCSSIRIGTGVREVRIQLRVTATDLARCDPGDPGLVQIRDSRGRESEDAVGIRYCGRHMVWRRAARERGDPDVGINELKP